MITETLLTPLNMLAGGVLLLVVVQLAFVLVLWWIGHEARMLADAMLAAVAQQAEAPPPALTSPPLTWGDTEPAHDASASVSWPHEPLWPDAYRQAEFPPRARMADEEDEG
jgi:hypothetical protein